MKLYTLIIISLVLTNCTNQKNITNEIANKIEYPFKIEFGAIGKGSNLPPTVFTINHDSVRISTSGKTSVKEIQNISLATKKTKFEELLSTLNKEDLEGDRHYFDPFIRDGRFMKISNMHGTKKFTNTFSNVANKSRIRPDTIGLGKFENISGYANSLFQEMR